MKNAINGFYNSTDAHAQSCAILHIYITHLKSLEHTQQYTIHQNLMPFS